MKNTSKFIAFAVVGFAVSALSAQRANSTQVAPNSNKATDGKSTSQNVTVDQNKSVSGSTTTNTSLTKPDINAGSVGRNQSTTTTNTSLVNPGKNAGAITAPTQTSSARVNNVTNPGQSSSINNNVANPGTSGASRLKGSSAVKNQNAGASQTTTTNSGK